jgi:outer membrane lipoprotein-sorting protein
MRKITLLALAALACLAHADQADKLLKKTAEAVNNLHSISAGLEYTVYEDNGIFETTTVYSGSFDFSKLPFDPNAPAPDELLPDAPKELAAIHFTTKSVDGAKPVSEETKYIFDGAWLTKIDYPLKEVTRIQTAPANKRLKAIELFSDMIPVSVFTDSSKLLAEYEVKLVSECEAGAVISLKPKKKVSAELLTIELNKTNGLFTKITTTLKDGGKNTLSFSNLKLNELLQKERFNAETPAGFTENINPREEEKR